MEPALPHIHLKSTNLILLTLPCRGQSKGGKNKPTKIKSNMTKVSWVYRWQSKKESPADPAAFQEWGVSPSLNAKQSVCNY